MTTYEDTVRNSLEAQETDVLLTKVKFGGLTDVAHTSALQILSQRGVDIENLPKFPISEESNGPKYWELTPEEKVERRYRMYGAVSILLLPLWTLGWGITSMSFSYKKGFWGIVVGLSLIVFTCTIPIFLSFRSLKIVEKSKSIYDFVGGRLYVTWMLSVGGAVFALLFSIYGVLVEAFKK
jgi:hypothetical protein